MPMYDYICMNCHSVQTEFRKIANRHDGPHCCDIQMQLKVCAPAVHNDLPSYQSPIDGRWIDGRKARNEDLRRNNCRPWEGIAEERKQANKVKQENEDKLAKNIEKTAYNVLNNMPLEKQRILKEAL